LNRARRFDEHAIALRSNEMNGGAADVDHIEQSVTIEIDQSGRVVLREWRGVDDRTE
jgi:hypothetical protein